MKRSGRWSFYIGLVITIALLLGLFWSLDWSDFLEHFRRVKFVYFVPLGLLLAVLFWLRALRWRLLLPRGAELSTRDLFFASLLGMSANCVLPLRAGEFVRSWVIGRWQPKVSFPTAFASVVTERVFDVIALLVLFGLSVSQMQEVPPLVILGGKALAGIAGAIVIAMLVCYLQAERILGVLGRVLKAVAPEHLASKLHRGVSDFVHGLRAISSLRDLAMVVLLSLLLWISSGIFYQVSLWTFGEFPSLWVGQVVSVVIAFAVAAPSSAAYAGTYELGCVISLSTIYRYPKEFALAYSVVTHVFQVALIILGGAIVLQLKGLSIRELSAEQEKILAQDSLV